MREIISRQEFKDRMNELIVITKTNALYAMDMVYPLLECNQDAEALAYISGQGSLMETLYTLDNNMRILKLDELVPEENDLVYFIDEYGMPSKTNQEQYDIIVNDDEPAPKTDEDVPYEDVLDNPDNEKMFG